MRVAALIFLTANNCLHPLRADPEEGPVFEARTKYSHILVQDRGSVRTLYFVRDSGEMVVESAVDLDRPHMLQTPYTKTMFASYLFRPKQNRSLIAGLGGGSMLHFLNRFFPENRLDVIEIDPVIVNTAKRFFMVKSGGQNNIIIGDAFKFIDRAPELYDVIYLDAYLKPDEKTDDTGFPLRMKTILFYKKLQSRLKTNGAVVFNLNVHGWTESDIATIKKTFPQAYVFTVPRRGNIIVVGSMVKKRLSRRELIQRGTELDRRIKGGFSFKKMVKHMR